ncbi:MAG: alpha/beta hydrolase [Betaproteobacteria bacterium]|nr:alpha/beta hydrolase [Betaproteobacteria bacterium]
MSYADANGVRLYYEETGSGTPIMWVHEFAGDCRSWEPQVRFFSRRYRCVTFNARGYPPSDVPESATDYSQEHAADDIAAVLRAAGIAKAHVVGFSMGGYATLHFGLRHPEKALSLTAVSVGFGSDPDKRAQFLKDTEEFAAMLERLGMAEAIKSYQIGPARVRYQNKDPRGFAEFCRMFAEHSARGSANTLRGFMMRRDTLQSLEARLRQITAPVHVITGDEDDNCLEPGVFMKRTIPGAALTVIPGSGHAVNLEEPDVFNRAVLDFLTLVDGGRWRSRDPRSYGKSTLSNKASP